MVMFIYREDYYLAVKQPADDHPDFAAWQEEMDRAYGRAELIVAKQRHGATGKVRLKFEAASPSSPTGRRRLAGDARLVLAGRGCPAGTRLRRVGALGIFQVWVLHSRSRAFAVAAGPVTSRGFGRSRRCCS